MTDNNPTKDYLEQLLLQHVASPDYQPSKPKAIARQLDLPEDSYRQLRKAIKKLVKKGRLVYAADHMVCAPGRKPDSMTGVFRRTAGGFGFVRPSAPDREAGYDEDIYISKSHSHDASTGDKVRVQVSKKPRRPGKEPGKSNLRGEIIEVLERETYRFVGTYDRRDGEPCVQVDGKVFAFPIPVSDPSAKGASPDDKVVIELVRFPSHYREGEGVIVEVLGNRGEEGVDTLTILREYNLPENFPDETLQAAREQVDLFDIEQFDDRHDWSNEPTITIDPKDARDFDDAISLRRIDRDHWQLAVHIADVAHFVPNRSELDREARDRATSVYLPDRVVPMLPELISNHLASLQPDRKRLTKTAVIEFTPDGARIATDLQNTIIKSDRRFTYEEVDDYLKAPQRWQDELAAPIRELLDHMHQLAMTLRRRRRENGALELSLPEVKIDLDRKGRVSGAHYEEYTVSHQIIEEFMLAANEAVADWLTAQGHPFLRRVHAAPAPRKLKSLTSFMQALGISCQSLESRFEIQRVVDSVAHLPEEHAVNYAVLRSMQKAVYSPQQEGHYALNSDGYCHFTSPIRRYPDLTVHRLVDHFLRGKRPTSRFDDLMQLADHCSDREQRAQAAERDLIKVKLLGLLAKHLGLKLEAVITGVEDYGFYAQGIRLPAEGLVHVNSLADDYYHFDRSSYSLEGHRAGNRFRLGDVVVVEVVRADVDRRLLDLRFVRRLDEREVTAVRKDPQPFRISAGSGTGSGQAPSSGRPAKPNKESPKTSAGGRGAKKKTATKKRATGKRNTTARSGKQTATPRKKKKNTRRRKG